MRLIKGRREIIRLVITAKRILAISILSILLNFIFSAWSNAQDSSNSISIHKAEKYLAAVGEKSADFEKSLDKYSQKALSRLLKQEQKINRIVSKKDSVLSSRLFDYAIESIQQLKKGLKNKEARVEGFLRRSRVPYIDSLKKTLLFFEKTAPALNSLSSVSKAISGAKEQIGSMESKLDIVNKIQAFIQDRKNVLGVELKAFPQLKKQIQQFRKEAFYYNAQVMQYKETLSSPKKIEQIVLRKLQTTPAFQKLTRPLPGSLSALFGNNSYYSGEEPVVIDSASIISGVPSRASVQKFIQTNSPGTSASFDPIQQIRQQADKAVDGMPGLPTGIEDLFRSAESLLETPKAQGEEKEFTPNSQRVKSFWKRIDYGADLTFGKSINYLPSTTNITLKLGYKLDDKKSLGVGLAYIMGMGTGWKHIAISHQGLGIKSYIKWYWSKGFALQGEAGWNYMTQFKNIEQLKYSAAWQKAGLIGISKDIKFTRKVKANVQFLFDVFYKTHIPYSQPTVFRFGYGF